MKHAFEFVQSLKPAFFELVGYPTIKVHSDFTEVYFGCTKVIKSLEPFNLTGYDDIRLFANDGCITIVYAFYDEEEEE